jgi:hypothetical protein
MRCIAVAFVLASTTQHGQILLEADKIGDALRTLAEQRDERQTLKCEVRPIKPELNFGFRFQAGYVMRVPLNQYLGSGHSWAVIMKITPEAGDRQPVYLGSRVSLPEVPKTNMEAELGGAFFLGEGRYRMEWTLADNMGRACRKDWEIEAELGRGERKVQVAMPPHTVAELSLRGAPKAEIEKADMRPARVTVLLNAAPMWMRRTRLRPSDTLMLMGSLSSLLERLPARSVRLVVFNLEQQTEIFRDDNFSPRSLNRVADALNSLELGSVDVKVLENTHGHIALLADLIRQELTATKPSEIVLFIGPASRYWDKLPQSEVEKPPSGSPHFFYLRFQPFFRRVASLPDSIQMAVGRLKGRTAQIHSPGDFAKAIEQIETQLAENK